MDSSDTPDLITATVVSSPEDDGSTSPRSHAASLRELAAIGLMVALADITLFRGHGYAGIGACLIFAPAIFVFGVPSPRWWREVRQLAEIALRRIRDK